MVKKPTGFMSSSRCIIQELDRKCTGDHDHVQLVGGRAAGAVFYPQSFCEAICRATSEQKKMDRNDNMVVNTEKMITEQIKNFTNQLCSIQSRGSNVIKKIMSMQRKDGMTRLTGVYPSTGPTCGMRKMVVMTCEGVDLRLE